MNECGPNCACKAGVSRRDVLKAGAGTAGLLAGINLLSAAPGHIPPAGRTPAPQAWWDQLPLPGPAITYTGDQLQKLIFPLGGIGTGTIWLHGSGRLVNWQIFNNIQKDSLVDDTFFAVRIEQEGKPPVVRILQQDSMGGTQGISDIRFTGRYPAATVQFVDPGLPVELELEAFNPLIPLDEKNSALPAAIFTVRVRNKTDAPMRVSILASCQNAVGHAGAGRSTGIAHTTYGGNINRPIREGQVTAVSMSASPGKPAEFSPPVELMVDHQNLPILADAPVVGLNLISTGAVRTNPALKTVYWLTDGDLRKIGAAVLSQVVQGVRERGDFLLLSGVNNPLMEPLRATAPADVRRRETVFASFDGGYQQWAVTGNAFAGGPSAGTNPNQQPVTGFTGGGLVNTYNPGDEVRGTLLSPPFQVQEALISFLIGGGQFANECCLNLKIDGKIVRTATGRNTERLERIEWNVAEFAGKEARLEIVDSRGGPWGHVLVDDIRFSNLPIDRITTDEANDWNALLREASSVPAMTATGTGRGRVMLVPVELATERAGVDRRSQRDRALRLIVSLAGVEYRPASGVPESAPSFGTMCLATAGAHVTLAAAWTSRDELLGRFREAGRLEAPAGAASPPSDAGRTVNAALCLEAAVPAAGAAEGTFIIAWHFPHQYYPQGAWRQAGNTAIPVGNMYANWYHDALHVARQTLADLQHLRTGTQAYIDAIFNTTLPQYLADAVAANVSIIRSPTCFWTRNDTFYGFEGCNYGGGGCCPMNCNHVWNYEQTLACLWPALERNMRSTELDYHQRADGGIHHRVEVPRDNPHKVHFPVADGQCGAVLKAYREHLNSSDRRFLDEHWAKIKKAMDFAIAEWDADADGIMEKPQFNTYDRVIYGHNTFVSSLYLAALRAAEEMARISRDDAAAKRYRALFEKGRAKIAESLFNGEYYIQKADNLNLGYGVGCWSDQVVGQWWARILHLGDILPVEQVRSALQAVFKHNFLWTQEGFEGTQRFLEFAEGRDKGLLCGSWPRGGRPEDPILYRDEIWTGVEYQVAAHKIYEDQVPEALAILRGARERYDGRRKSPWNEIECGDYYARALSSWSLLLAAQGCRYNGPERALAFAPRLSPDAHRSMFTAANGWGRFEQRRDGNKQIDALALLGGRCDLRELRFALPAGAKAVTVDIRSGDNKLIATVGIDAGEAVIRLSSPVTVQAGESLVTTLEWS